MDNRLEWRAFEKVGSIYFDMVSILMKLPASHRNLLYNPNFPWSASSECDQHVHAVIVLTRLRMRSDEKPSSSKKKKSSAKASNTSGTLIIFGHFWNRQFKTGPSLNHSRLSPSKSVHPRWCFLNSSIQDSTSNKARPCFSIVQDPKSTRPLALRYMPEAHPSLCRIQEAHSSLSSRV